MSAPQNIIAVVFDFDDTLTNDSTTKLLEAHGIDPKQFWGQAKELVQAGWNPTLAYLRLMLDQVGEGKPLGMLANAALRDFGSGLAFYPGIPGLFNALRKMTKEHPLSNPAVEFYVVSGGLEEIIRGSTIARHMNGIWGCRFAEGARGAIEHITQAISFTEKTKCLFEINKGVVDESRTNPYAVNEYVRSEDHRIPFRNIIYLGDGLTDVPCFSLVDHNDGSAFGVFDPKREGSPKNAFEKLVAPSRVKTMNAPKYRKTDELGALLRGAVKKLCVEIDLRTKTVRSS